MPSANIALVNGVLASSVSTANRGLMYGDGLFETIKVIGSVPLFLEEHLSRLADGCDRLNIPFDEDIIRKDILSLFHTANINNDSFSILKLIITRGECGRGYQSAPNIAPNRVVSLSMNSVDNSSNSLTGVKLRICNKRLPDNPELAGIKHLNRLDNVLARSEWNDSIHAEGLMLDQQGRLIEGTMSNVFLVKKNQLYTPVLNRCGVVGIIRNLIMREFADNAVVSIFEKNLTVADIITSDEMFVCNSLIGVWPVVAVGCHQKVIGPVTKQIQQMLNQKEIQQQKNVNQKISCSAVNE